MDPSEEPSSSMYAPLNLHFALVDPFCFVGPQWKLQRLWLRRIVLDALKGLIVHSAIPEDAQEAASKMNKKNLYGSVISVEIAKPKKKSMRIRREDSLGVGREEVLKSMNKEEQVEGKVEEEEKEEKKEEKKEEEKEKEKSTYSDKLQDKTIHRLQTVLVFGLPPQMKPENIRKKYKVFSFFTYRFPCPAPFNGRDMVAEITVKDSKQIKDVFTPLFP